MVKIKSLETIKNRWSSAIPRVPGAYKEGVSSVTDWKERALEGQSLYEKKMSDAAILKRRAKALENVSTDEWKSKAANLGSARIGAGMSANVDKYTKGFAPFREAIANTSLPPRSEDGMQNLTNRAGAVVQALIQKKKELVG